MVTVTCGISFNNSNTDDFFKIDANFYYNLTNHWTDQLNELLE